MPDTQGISESSDATIQPSQQQTGSSLVSLVIPAYNEEERLAPFLKSILEAGPSISSSIQEIIIVDDGSTDETIRIAEQYQVDHSNIVIIKHDTNKGKGAAVRTGVMNAKGDLVIFTDADGATPITELPKMISALHSHEIGVGNRWMKGAVTERHSLLRQLSGFVYRTYMSLFGLGKIDTMCGFKGYRQPIAKKLFNDLKEERWLFDTEIAYRAVRANYAIKNFPIHWESKDGSKLDTATLIMTAFQILPLLTRIRQESNDN